MPEGQPLRLYCFPHAGAGVSSFGRWRTVVGAGTEIVPVLLPGRGPRRAEHRVTDRRALLADLLRTVGRPPGGPYVLYGHSLGGLIAYTATRAIQEAGLNPPALVVVGASPPPDVSAPALSNADLPDDQLVRLLTGFGSVPAGAEPGGVWQRFTLPVLRDDLRLARALRDAADRPIESPLLVLSGRDDPLAGPRTTAGWRHWSTGPVVERTLPGDHFFVRGRDLPRLLRRACQVVRRVAEPGPVRARAPQPAVSRRTAMERDSQ